MKVLKSEARQIIKEEVAIFRKEQLLKKELASIEKQLNEVKAGGEMDPNQSGGVHAGQRKPVFTKKGTHLVEDQEEETLDIDLGGDFEDEMSTDVTDIADEANPSEEIMNAFKMLAKACGLTGVISLDDETEGSEMDAEITDDVIGADDSSSEEEIEVIEPEDTEIEVSSDETSDESSEDESEEETEEVTMEEAPKAEATEEVKEESAQVMTESFNAERNRMIQLAGINK